MKKKILASMLLATLVFGTLSPMYSEAAAKKVTTTKAKTQTKKTTTATKTKEQTKIDGVAIKDLITGKYNDISIIKSTTETKDVTYNRKKIFYTSHRVRQSDFYYETDKLYNTNEWLTNKVVYGKDYKNKTIDYGDGYTVTYADRDTSEDDSEYFFIPKALNYDSDNPTQTLDDNGDDYIYVTPILSRNEEIARWRLDPSCFKTAKTKLTEDEIIIQGTYTFKAEKLADIKDIYLGRKNLREYINAGLFVGTSRKTYGDYRFDGEFFTKAYTYNSTLKDVKCDATVIFYRDTKQLKSLNLKAKLPKDGYRWKSWYPEVRTMYNVSYAFEHQL